MTPNIRYNNNKIGRGMHLHHYDIGDAYMYISAPGFLHLKSTYVNEIADEILPDIYKE